MTQVQMAPATINHSNFSEITKSCEKLVNETQTDLKNFRDEQQLLRAQILDILEENNRLKTKLEVFKNQFSQAAHDCGDDATREKLTYETLCNVKKQIDSLQAENNEFRSLNQSSQKIIERLETEIQNYRNQLFKPKSFFEIKQKYGTAIQLLEGTIKNQKAEVEKQAEIIETIFVEKKQLRQQIHELKANLEEKNRRLNKSTEHEAIIETLQKQLKETLRQSKEMEKTLKQSKQEIEDRFKREKCALMKVQEALSIAETAVADKEEAIKREQVMKEEYDHMASTIGQVMEEAAQKVEKDMKVLQMKSNEKERLLKQQMKKLEEDLEYQTKYNNHLKERCDDSEQKYKESVDEGERLRRELQFTINTLQDVEKKLLGKENLLKMNSLARRLADEHERQIQEYIYTNKKIKQDYKAALEDLTGKFQEQMLKLRNENSNLKTELQLIRLKLNCARDKN